MEESAEVHGDREKGGNRLHSQRKNARKQKCETR